MSNIKFKVFVDDNYDLFSQDGDSRALVGTYTSIEEAVEKCREIVKRSIMGSYMPGNTARELMSQWRFGGASAFIAYSDEFSAKEYAEECIQRLFEIEKFRTTLRECIFSASGSFKKNQTYDDENPGGGLSIKECSDLAEEKALAAISIKEVYMEDYQEKVIDNLQNSLANISDNSFDYFGLAADALREYIIPAILEAFENF